MPEEEKRSYVIARHDGFVVHTKPITEDEALWLWDAYEEVEDRRSRIRYLSEYGNVLDVSEYVRRLVQQLGQQLEELKDSPHFFIGKLYRDPDGLAKSVRWLLERRNLPPEARQTVKELLDKIEDFLRRPVEPRPVDAPVRYLESPNLHVTFGPGGVALEVTPRPEWYAYTRDMYVRGAAYGISIFKDSLWLWWQSNYYVQVVAVRRDATDGEVINAVLDDEAVQAFLRRYDRYFRELVMEHEAELIDKGYADVVRKAKIVLTTVELLTAGRGEEEALPA